MQMCCAVFCRGICCRKKEPRSVRWVARLAKLSTRLVELVSLAVLHNSPFTSWLACSAPLRGMQMLPCMQRGGASSWQFPTHPHVRSCSPYYFGGSRTPVKGQAAFLQFYTITPMPRYSYSSPPSKNIWVRGAFFIPLPWLLIALVTLLAGTRRHTPNTLDIIKHRWDLFPSLLYLYIRQQAQVSPILKSRGLSFIW